MSRAAPVRMPWVHVDPLLAAAVAALLLLGLTMMTSASIALAERDMGAPLYFLQRQGLFTLLGLAAGALCLLVPTRWWQAGGFACLTLALALLTLVLLPGVGHTVNGATRWIDLGPMNLQVSEPARLLIFVYVCSYLVRHGERVRESLMGFARPMLFVLLACALLLLEPDFGAASVLLGTVLGVMFIGGVRLRDYALLVTGALGGMAALIYFSAYRLERFTGFRDPFADAADSGFQLVQSLVAIGRGEWFGVGLGGSVQKLFYLPESHTDFVFAVLAEELGLAGAALTIALYFALLARGFAIARRAAALDRLFAAYLAYAIVIWFGLQSFVNIGVNMGVLPTKGLTLPLISYGGSSLIVTLVSLALLLRVHHESRVAEAQTVAGGAA